MSRIVTTFLTGHSLPWPRKPGLAYLQGTIIEKMKESRDQVH